MLSRLHRTIAAIRGHLSRDLREGNGIVFITGRSKSGNTWIGHILNAHPAAYCDLFENNGFHQHREVRYFSQASASRTDTYFTGYSDHRDARLAQFGLLYSLSDRNHKPFARILADKTPRQHLPSIFAAFPRARCIIALRDPRDAMVSLAFHHARAAGDWRGAFKTDEMLALDDNFMRVHLQEYQRVRDIENYLEQAKRTPDQVLLMRYEDLKASPEPEVHRLFRFLRINSTAKRVHTAVKETTFERLSGGRPEGQQDVTSFFRRGTTGDWKHHFDQSNLETFIRYGEDQAILAGYPATGESGAIAQ
jgi:hypothetical protein